MRRIVRMSTLLLSLGGLFSCNTHPIVQNRTPQQVGAELGKIGSEPTTNTRCPVFAKTRIPGIFENVLREKNYDIVARWKPAGMIYTLVGGEYVKTLAPESISDPEAAAAAKHKVSYTVSRNIFGRYKFAFKISQTVENADVEFEASPDLQNQYGYGQLEKIGIDEIAVKMKEKLGDCPN